MSDAVNHPAHYGGEDNPYEAIKVIEAWNLNFCLGNTVKYISRAGKKEGVLQDLEKARWYLDREIEHVKILLAEVDLVREMIERDLKEGAEVLVAPPTQGDIRYINPDGSF